eukprot:4698775-Alexandrium_andersonii.AAC.1
MEPGGSHSRATGLRWKFGHPDPGSPLEASGLVRWAPAAWLAAGWLGLGLWQTLTAGPGGLAAP